MVWSPKAQIQLANDLVTASLALDPDSETRAAFQTMANAIIGSALAADPSLAAQVLVVATDAVNDRVSAEDLLKGGEPRSPEDGDPGTFEVETLNHGKPFRVTGDEVHMGPDLVTPDEHFIVETLNGGRMIDGDPVTSAVKIPFLEVLTLNGEPVGSSAVTGATILDGRGQSGMEGRAENVAELLRFDPRLMMYRWPYEAQGKGNITNPDSSHPGTLVPATVPLSSRQAMTGASVLTIMAQEILRRRPPGHVVILVNSGVGDSGLVTAPVAGCWAVDFAGSVPGLMVGADWALAKTRELVAERLPGVPVDVVGVWDHGEADMGAPDGYAAALDTAVAHWRSAAGLPNMPVVVAGLVPEYIASRGSGGADIRNALLGLPARMYRTGYADGIPNAGGSQNVGDTVHAGLDGIREQGPDLVDALERAWTNVPESVPRKPLHVEARYIGGTLTVSWSTPLSAVQSYTVSYRVNGGAPVTVVTPSIDTTLTVAGLAGAITEVKVATTNAVGTTAYSMPLTPIGA